MQDLNATMFYKAKFTVHLKDDSKNDDLLWKLILLIKEWATRKFNFNEPSIDTDVRQWSKFKKGSRLYDLTGKDRIYAESVYHVSQDDSNCVSWACRFEEHQMQDESHAPRTWRTEIGYQAKDKYTADISYVITYSDLPGYIGFCEDSPYINIPRIVRFLLQDRELQCTIGEQTLSLLPLHLTKDRIPDFTDTLFNPEREIPILLMSTNETGQYLISPEKLAECVAGNALVYCSNTLDLTKYLCDSGYEDYTCTGGAIRLYKPHPNVQDTNNHVQHRYLTSAFIQEHGADAVLNIFRRALAQDVHYYQKMFRLVNCQALIDADERKKILKSHLELEEVWRMANTLDEELTTLQKDHSDITAENERLRTANNDLNSRVDSMSESYQRCSDLEKSLAGVRKFDQYPSTSTAIGAYFESVFCDRIVFTDRGRKSLNDCITKPEMLWEALYLVATLLYQLLQEDPVHAYKKFSDSTPYRCERGVGAQTHSDPKLMQGYMDTYNGKEFNAETHIKKGTQEDNKSIRIYFYYDAELTNRIIISSCGKHIANHSTRKRK